LGTGVEVSTFPSDTAQSRFSVRELRRHGCRPGAEADAKAPITLRCTQAAASRGSRWS